MIYGEFYCDSSKFYSCAQRINFQLYISINILCINCYIFFFIYIVFYIDTNTHTRTVFFNVEDEANWTQTITGKWSWRVGVLDTDSHSEWGVTDSQCTVAVLDATSLAALAARRAGHKIERPGYGYGCGSSLCCLSGSVSKA